MDTAWTFRLCNETYTILWMKRKISISNIICILWKCVTIATLPCLNRWKWNNWHDTFFIHQENIEYWQGLTYVSIKIYLKQLNWWLNRGRWLHKNGLRKLQEEHLELFRVTQALPIVCKVGNKSYPLYCSNRQISIIAHCGFFLLEFPFLGAIDWGVFFAWTSQGGCQHIQTQVENLFILLDSLPHSFIFQYIRIWKLELWSIVQCVRVSPLNLKKMYWNNSLILVP